jgi:hypothetical protein
MDADFRAHESHFPASDKIRKWELDKARSILLELFVRAKKALVLHPPVELEIYRLEGVIIGYDASIDKLYYENPVYRDIRVNRTLDIFVYFVQDSSTFPDLVLDEAFLLNMLKVLDWCPELSKEEITANVIREANGNMV